jgi:hypothetical protein
VLLYRSDGDGSFAEPETFPLPAIYTNTPIADFDGDGSVDFVTIDRATEEIVVRFGGIGELFVSEQRYAPCGDFETMVEGDFDGDGAIDLAVACDEGTENYAQILLNDGSGSFTTHSQSRIVSNVDVYVSTDRMLARDVDLDGDFDLVANVYHWGGVALLRNDGNAVFTPEFFYVPGSRTSNFDLGDLDGDGDPDLAVIDGWGAFGQTYVLSNDGDGNFTVMYADPREGARDVRIADLNADGLLDLIIGSGTGHTGRGQIEMLYNTGGTEFSPLRFTYAHTETVEDPLPNVSSLSYGDIDADGDLDIASTGENSGAIFLYENRHPAGVPCNISDIARPFCVHDLGDIVAFIGAFTDADPLADLTEPFGTFDLSDITVFVGSFVSGCP